MNETMSDFDLIEYGYNTADETINFGTRNIAEGTNLHEATTLATLKYSDLNKGVQNPHINAFVHGGYIYFSIEHSIKVFADKECSDITFNVNFDYVVDTFCVFEDYLLVCLRNGSVHFVNTTSEEVLLYELLVINDIEEINYCDKFFINVFIEDVRFEETSFILVTKKGQIYRLIYHGKKIEAECIYDFQLAIETACFQNPCLLVNGSKLANLDIKSGSVLYDTGSRWDFKRICSLDHYFLALDFEGSLFKICMVTLLIFPIENSTFYKDFMIASDLNNQSQIIAITRDESQQCHIQVFSFPELSVIYSLKLSNDIDLIKPESLNDELLYISKLSNENNIINEIRFHMVCETKPEQRLQRLLRKHKYEEAEKFAKFFKLDLSEISKAKAQMIVEASICDSGDIDNLINLLNAIDDDEFKLNCCLDVESSCSQMEDVKKILNYGCSLPLKKSDRFVEAAELQKALINLLYRFETFSAVVRGNNYKTEWLLFSGCNLIEELKFLLKNNYIEEAKIIYNRLDESAIRNLTENEIADILSVLNNLSMATYQSFLPSFIPITLSILPSTQPLFVKWTFSKVYHLEKRYSVDFPTNAIDFTEKIVGLMKVDDGSDISFQKQCTLHRYSFAELSSLLSTLKNLRILKDDYGITIPVKDYLAGPQNVIRILFNVEMYFADFDKLLKNFLQTFMLENNLEPNEIFLSEVKDLMNYEEKYWVNIVPSILCCINSVSVKLVALKEILNSASVPWCDTLRQVAKDSLKYFHPLVAEIKKIIKNEPRQVVLRKPKYKIKERRISDINIFKSVIKTVIYHNEETMIEDVMRLCETDVERHLANKILITHFIDNGNLKKAVELLDNNTSEECVKCARELAVSIESAINKEMKVSYKLRNYYYEVAGLIFKRLNGGIRDKFELEWNKETLNLLRNVYSLDKNFQKKTTTYNLRRLENKNKLVDEILQEHFELFESGKETFEEIFSVCYKIASSLSLDTADILMKLCTMSEDYKILLKTAQKIFDSDSSSRNLCLMAVLLLKYLGIEKLYLPNDNYSDSESFILSNVESIDNDDFYKGLQFAESIITQAIFKAKGDELPACMEVAKWVNTTFYSLKSENSLKHTLFGDKYDSSSLIPGFLTFSCIRNTFCSYYSFIRSFNNPDNMYLTYFKTELSNEDELLNLIEQLPQVVENLCKEGQHFSAFKVIATLQNSIMVLPQMNADVVNFINDMLKNKCIPKLLSSILGNRIVDIDLLYNLLLCCDNEVAVHFVISNLRLYKRHPKKFEQIIQVGLRFWKYNNISSGSEEMLGSLLTLKWWRKFDKKLFEYDDFFKNNADHRFEMLVNADCMNKELVEEYCRDYNLVLTPSYLYFLNKTFLNWKPVYEIKTDISGKRHLFVENNNSFLNKSQEVMKVLDKQGIQKVITAVWSSVNKYYYEVLIALLNISAEIDPTEDNSTKINMLLFLKNYQRVSKPSEMETENWYTNFPDTQCLDPLSEFRLPFTKFLFTKKIWDIIRPEITLKTYNLWFDAIQIVAPFLNKNDICCYVIKDIVASGILSKDTTEEWVLYPKHENLFREIRECVLHISDPERTTSAVYHLLTYTPKGADQVTAAALCYEYALKYKELNPRSVNVERAFVKVEKKYFTCHALHILHMCRLAEEKYVNLVTSPNELILALYMDERILKKSKSAELYCPDINKATEKLADLFKLDIRKIRVALIEGWLSDGSTSTFDFDSSIIVSQTCTSDEDNLKRAAYVCCADDVRSWQMQLIHMGLGSELQEQKSASYRARALKVFVMISDVETIVNCTELTYDELINFIDKLSLASNLEYLGIVLDADGLDQYNKKELLSRLAYKKDSVLAIKTMAGICMRYQMYDLKYWEFILKSSIKHSMFGELKSYVCFLKNVKYQNKHFYINAWQKLIEHSFQSLNNVQSNQLNATLISNFLMIQSCPVLFSLKFKNIFKKCIDIGKVEFAAVLLQYFDDTEKGTFVKEILAFKRDLIPDLNSLNEKGLCGIYYVQNMLSWSTK